METFNWNWALFGLYIPHKKDLLNLINKDCFLLTQKYEKTEIPSFTFNEIGEFYINVVAIFENPIS